MACTESLEACLRCYAALGNTGKPAKDEYSVLAGACQTCSARSIRQREGSQLLELAQDLWRALRQGCKSFVWGQAPSAFLPQADLQGV